jgi:hypothetical protein
LELQAFVEQESSRISEEFMMAEFEMGPDFNVFPSEDEHSRYKTGVRIHTVHGFEGLASPI